jgi:hypothetical protein
MFFTHPSNILLFEFVELEIFKKFQKIPLPISTDRQSQFRTLYWKNLLQKNSIPFLSSLFYAQTDGLTERSIQLILNKLRIPSVNKIRITKDILVTATAAINSTVSSVTKDTPAGSLTKFMDYLLTKTY